MREKNIFQKLEFIKYTLFLSASAGFCYRNVFFKPLVFGNFQFGGIGFDFFHTTTFQSRIIYWLMFIIFISLGTFLCFKNKRNTLSLFLNIAFPLELYTLISTARYMQKFYTISLILITLVSVAYFSLVIFQKVKNKTNFKPIMINRIKFASYGVRTIAIILLLLVTLPINLRHAFGYELFSVNNDVSLKNTSEDTWRMKNHMETICKLKQDVWKTLSTEEKMQVLNVVKNIEMNYLGIVEDSILLVAGILDENTLGFFDSKESVICINIEHLLNAPAEDVLKTLLHECNHVYTYNISRLYEESSPEFQNLLLFHNADCYVQEYNQSSPKNYDEYYSQECERSARLYAENNSFQYYYEIDKYLEEQNKITTEE